MDAFTFPYAFELALFRITIHKAGPNSPALNPSLILKKHLLANSIIRLRKNSIWRVGNISQDERQIYFRFGREVKSNLNSIDENGNFTDESELQAPYVHILLDPELGIFGISKNSELGSRYSMIAKRFVDCFNSILDSSGEYPGVEAELREIYDPKDFFNYLGEAISVSALWVLLRRKNPWDQNEHFAKPATKMMDYLGAHQVRTEWGGPALETEQDSVRDLVQSAAATGGDAGATVALPGRKRKKRIRLAKGVVTLFVEAGQSIIEAFWALREKYNEIRNGKDKNEE